MSAVDWQFDDNDLAFLVRYFMPDCKDVNRMIRVLRNDPDMLESMLTDPGIADYMLRDAVKIVRASPYLFFTIVLQKVRNDLRNRAYTFERDSRRMMVIFDTNRIVELLEEQQVIPYLADMLTSFVKIHAHTVSVRLRKGIWRTQQFSDFDLEGLIRYLDMTGEEFRFPIYKRIADLCLFQAGLFCPLPNEAQSGRSAATGSPYRGRRIARRSPQEYYDCGRHYYRVAARHSESADPEVCEVLDELSDNFELAAKPLAFMADHYLGPFRTKVFDVPPRT